MTTAATVLNQEEKFRTLWHRTYAPLRRSLAGSWIKREETAQFELRFDLDGGFELTCYDSMTFLKGRYTIVSVEGAYWIAFDCTDGNKNAVRIEDVDMWRLKLSWLDNPGHVFELVRRNDEKRAAAA